jgi:hypothetical protein
MGVPEDVASSTYLGSRQPPTAEFGASNSASLRLLDQVTLLIANPKDSMLDTVGGKFVASLAKQERNGVMDHD